MPAVIAGDLTTQIETALKAVLNDKGEPYFAKRNLDGTPISPVELADGTKKMIEGIATGIAAQWLIWQAAQTVTGTAAVSTAPGVAPVTGILP